MNCPPFCPGLVSIPVAAAGAPGTVNAPPALSLFIAGAAGIGDCGLPGAALLPSPWAPGAAGAVGA
jgi:hypothetical protein